jgi:hypothetical protein
MAQGRAANFKKEKEGQPVCHPIPLPYGSLTGVNFPRSHAATPGLVNRYDNTSCR